MNNDLCSVVAYPRLPLAVSMILSIMTILTMMILVVQGI